MNFKKFTSIENTYRQQFIDKFNIQKDDIFIAREKLDGANIQLVFQPNKEVIVGRRTAYLDRSDNFFDIWTTLARYETNMVNILQEYVNNNNATVTIYGELYGPGINNRVDYGNEKHICIFDMILNDKLLTQSELQTTLDSLDLEFLLPTECGIGTLESLIQFDVENMFRKGSEGIVIQPYNINIFSGNERLILKKKSKAFDDVKKEKNKYKLDNEVISYYNKIFKSYITENRVLDIFSKYGKIQNISQLGQYIVYVLEDAKVDFLKGTDLQNFDKNETKDLYNAGGLVVKLLKAHL